MDKELNKKGYNKEEEYFHKLNKKLIEKMKKKDRAEPAKQPPKNLDK